MDISFGADLSRFTTKTQTKAHLFMAVSHEKSTKSLPVAVEAAHSIAETLQTVDSTSGGLIEEEASRRLNSFGPNEAMQEKKTPVLFQFLGAFNDAFIYLLFFLAAISFVTDYWIPLRRGEETDISETAIILGMVTLSVVLRFFQEYRSSKAAQTLKAMVRSTATVLRRSNEPDSACPDNEKPQKREIPIRELVPGDIVLLSSGDIIPADVKPIESRSLFVSQTALTGEALPVEKRDINTDDYHTVEKSVGDDLLSAPNICFMGTNVVSGTAKAVVIGTGKQTYFGSLARRITQQRGKTSFDRGVDSVSRLLIRFMMVMVPIVFVINGIDKGDWLQAFLFATAVAVGLTPGMLPMIVSVNLAKGALSLAGEKVIVKYLSAIQNFGAMNILCTDKTGTLTQDRIILENHINLNDDEDDDVLALAWQNSRFETGLKNLIDEAVVRFAREKLDESILNHYTNKIDELPFDFDRRRLSIIVSDDRGNQMLICKGAVEEMFSVCTVISDGENEMPLDAEKRKKMLNIVRKYEEDGFRVMAVAFRKFAPGEAKSRYTVADEKDLTLKGLLTFLDPPKETAGSAIRTLHEHGVAVKILTGDNEIITAKICREVNLNPGIPLLGGEIEKMSDAELTAKAETTTIFAKLSPLQKSRVLKSLQAGGHTVGFLGDGINDAPALHDADVGISVDSGTDIAKESADIILLEKNLMVLQKGVLEGRRTFGNIIKYLNITASSNFGNVFTILVACVFLPFLPMLPIHILILNLLYDFSQIALPWDNVDEEFTKKPRTWDAGNIGRFMVCAGPVSSLFDILTFLLLWFVFAANSVEHQSLFQSGWFLESLLSQILVVYMLRTRKIPFLQSTPTLPVLVMTGFVMLVGMWISFSPIGRAVGLQALPGMFFPCLLFILLGYCILIQLVKMFYIQRFGRWL